MFKLRAVREDDLEDLYELSLFVSFINLPPDKAIIEQKIESSLKSFQDPSKDLAQNHYMFILEDMEFDKVVGEPMDVLIGGRLMCRGEIVVVNERYGIRISEVVRAEDSKKEFL